jgi:hypothetical protein
MKALVVYESMYGNTAAVGEAIADSLRSQGLDVDAGPVSRVGPGDAANAGLLVLGGPTHVHGMSRASTRESAVRDEKNTYGAPTMRPGLREWIQAMSSEAGRLAAAFDTRIDKPLILTGSAAKGIARRLERRGCHLVVEPECFLVTAQNSLVEGEIEHATRWAGELAERATAATVR